MRTTKLENFCKKHKLLKEGVQRLANELDLEF